MKLIFAADLVPAHDHVSLFEKDGTATLYHDIPALFADADMVAVNLECALTNADTPIKKIGPCLKADPRAADSMKALGVTHALLANNHIYDYGHTGLADTYEALDKAGIVHMGTGKDLAAARAVLYFEKEGKKIAVVNVCEHEYTYALDGREGANPFDCYDTPDDIREAKKHADHVIVVYHGGKEHCKYPSPRLYKLCRALVRCGASAVLCQHSHCIGCAETYMGAPIVYGQGNFHFTKDEPRGEGWETGIVACLTVGDKLDIAYIPVIKEGRGMRLASKKESADILAKFDARSKELETGKWQDRWRDFVESACADYRDAPGKTADGSYESAHRLAHYLDCEAHTDVLRELFKTCHIEPHD